MCSALQREINRSQGEGYMRNSFVVARRLEIGNFFLPHPISLAHSLSLVFTTYKILFEEIHFDKEEHYSLLCKKKTVITTAGTFGIFGYPALIQAEELSLLLM